MGSGRYGYRLHTGGLIDRTRTISFAFNGRVLEGYPGDTLASALIANGVNIIGRSFKYHRPRGFYGVGLEDPNSMLAVRDGYGYDPALRAGQVRLSEGLQAYSVTGWPSPDFDVAAGVQLLSGVLSVGFYYKTFKWPSWRLFEPIIRRSTGFGRPTATAENRQVRHRHDSCDVLVIGGGPAGLFTAHALRGKGFKIVLADDQPNLGGSFLWETAQIDGQSALSFSRKLVAELKFDPAITLLPATLVAGAYESNVFTLVQTLCDGRGVRGECHWKLKADRVVLATGMIDRPLLFGGNDRPGVMLSSSVRRLIGEFAVAPARRLAIYTNNDSGSLTAIKARHAEMEVAALIDTRPESEVAHSNAVRELGIPCYFESQIETTFGYRRVKGLIVRGRNGRKFRIQCDGVASSGGWTPTMHLVAHRGIKPAYDERRGFFVCRNLPDRWLAAGGVNGALDLETVWGEAQRAAAAIADGVSDTPEHLPPMVDNRRMQIEAASFGSVTPTWLPQYGSTNEMWIDFQNDVKVSDIELAVQESYSSVEHLKRYTTLGMGTDQGRTSNVNGLAVLAALSGREVSGVGTTTFRPPYTAVRMATIADGRRGNLYRPRRYLPADTIHRQLTAVMEDFGWERPDWYRSNGEEREIAVTTEMRAVREHVGVFDGSSLGKIEITGPDARKFLAKFYVSNMSTLKPGRLRYSVMLREDGVIFDDGVVGCISENHFLASSTSGNAEAVAAWLERWRQTEWPSLQVAISPITENWAVMAIAGPKARELLYRLEPDFDVSSLAFTHMEFREGMLGGVCARVSRVSFTGELQYEIATPARYAESLFQALLIREPELKPQPVGLEAWLRLRLEKGYIHIGTDTNGRTTPLDIGMDAVVASRRDDFIGKRSLSLPFALSAEREQLVGVKAQDRLDVGGRILAGDHPKAPGPTEGYITSACYSPSLGCFIGLALLERGRHRQGESLSIYSGGKIVRCRVCALPFYNPKNDKLQA